MGNVGSQNQLEMERPDGHRSASLLWQRALQLPAVSHVPNVFQTEHRCRS